MIGLFKKCVSVLCFVGLTNCAAGIDYFVSADGNDSNPGSKEQPFATLSRARDEIRNIKAGLSILPTGATIYIRGGIYRMDSSFILTGRDGGVADAPIIYKAWNSERVRITGGFQIQRSHFKPFVETNYTERIKEATARKNLRVVDLQEIGISSFGDICGDPNKRMELIFKNKYMQLARYPNNEWLHIRAVPQSGDKLINEGRSGWVIEGIPRGRHYGYFVYPDDRPSGWKDCSQIYMQGYWVYDWQDEVIKVARFDLAKRYIFPAEPHHRYGYQKEARFYFMNILEEVDSPGEWYLDRDKGMLVFWPLEQGTEGEMFFPTTPEPLFVLRNTSNIRIEGIDFQCSRAEGVVITNGSDNVIAGCKFVNLGDPAVKIDGGSANGIQSCDIYETSGTGVDIKGGDRKTLSPCRNYVVNNHIHHFARVYRTYHPAVMARGVGIRIANNYIHDAPHEGIDFGGNDIVIERNEITKVCQETEDVGGIYGYSDWSFCGNIIRYNYLHDIHGEKKYVDSRAVYFDLPVGGALLYGNIFYDLDTGFFDNSGRSNVVANNIFVKCNPSIFVNVYRAPKEFVPGGSWKMVEKLQEVNYTNPPYSERYPWLAKVLSQGDDPAIPSGNVIMNNISYGGKFLCLHGELDFSIVHVCNNVIADPLLCSWRNMFQEQAKGDTLYRFGDPNMSSKLRSYENILVDPDQFVDLKGMHFSLPKGSPVLGIDFQPIPFGQIGIQKDKYRTEMP